MRLITGLSINQLMVLRIPMRGYELTDTAGIHANMLVTNPHEGL